MQLFATTTNNVSWYTRSVCTRKEHAYCAARCLWSFIGVNVGAYGVCCCCCCVLHTWETNWCTHVYIRDVCFRLTPFCLCMLLCRIITRCRIWQIILACDKNRHGGKQTSWGRGGKIIRHYAQRVRLPSTPHTDRIINELNAGETTYVWQQDSIH